MLAVTVAAVSGGIWAGIVAALVSSVALPLVERPDVGFQFKQFRDVIAAVVFLAIAAVVGLVVGNAAAERRRATEREREARLLAYLSSKLLSGDLPDRVLDEFVGVLLEPFALATCTVQVTLDGQEMSATARREGVEPGGPTEVVPVVIASIPLGSLITERPARAKPFSRREHELLEAATRQAAVALDRARLDARARLAQLDAETNQLRAAMFSSVTHDLRTPLASIKAGVTSLLDTSTVHDAAQQRDLLLTVLEETDRLNRLVGNILDLARIRAGALIPRRASTDVEEVAEAVVARMRPQLTSVRLELQLTDELPEIPADPVQLDQVFTNLLENAARHSPAGGDRCGSTSDATTDRCACGSPTRARGSRRVNARRSSSPSIVVVRIRSVPAAGSASRSFARSSPPTAGASGSRRPRPGAPPWCSTCRSRRQSDEGARRRRRTADPPRAPHEPRGPRLRGRDGRHGRRRGRRRRPASTPS